MPWHFKCEKQVCKSHQENFSELFYLRNLEVLGLYEGTTIGYFTDVLYLFI